jgi:PAS domain S-box-containing protein
VSANPFREPASLGESLEELRGLLLARLRPPAATADPRWEKRSQALLTHLIRALDQDNLEPVLFDEHLRGCTNPEVLIEQGRKLRHGIYQLLEERRHLLAPRDARILSDWFGQLTEYALREENRRHRAMLDAVPDCMVLKSATGEVLYANRSALEAKRRPSGTAPGELNDQSLPEVPEEFRVSVEADFRRTFAGETVTSERRFPVENGWRWREIHGSPLFGPDGTVTAAVFTIRDIHLRKMAEGRLKFLSKVGTLTEALENEGVLAAVARMSVPDLADFCIIDVVEGETTEAIRRGKVSHQDPARAALADSLLGPLPEEAYQSEDGRAVLAGKARLVSDYDERADLDLRLGLLALRPLSAMVVPFVLGGRTIAVATFVTTGESSRRYGADDLAVAEAMARRAAHIIENAQLHQELRDREASLRIALARLNIWVFEQDASLRYRWSYNPMTSESDLFSNDSICGADAIREIVHADKLHVLATGERTRSESKCALEGDARHFVVTQEALRSATGDIVGLIGSAVDVTEEKRIQNELAAALEFRDRVIAIIGHDLRNPLSAVLGIVGLARLDQTMPQVQRNHFHQIDTAARRMIEMIKSLLDFTQARFVGRLPIAPAPTDVRELCLRVLAEYRATHPECTIEVEVGGDVRGEWDGGRISQVISNLVGNAIGHGDPAEPIRLSIDGDDANVQIRVHNKGTPISSELLPLLFQPFRRGDGDRPRGLGLGLYIVQQIVMAHGGSIEVTSTLEDGTTFVARLPRANSSAASPS